ncbi:hypothetical protein MIND_00956200 [Mycena indigotica]|uniref:Zn(2)-C6 fungal-type domain-containing protein n=1 Tax=Mycena indigotica TaxID=2126181 RepID=A0A8H6SCX0_9AGAR|nr:uncharacterized protein MIND_00956200 [Mycena indigotica]KAF7297231.1 hypothetical protein MIND_00956200 [Mycena indigotica]
MSRRSTAGKAGKSAIPTLQRGQACHSCRYRKLRCDGVRPTCGPCLDGERQEDCEYTGGARRARAEILQENIRSVEQKISELEARRSLKKSLTYHTLKAGSEYEFALTIELIDAVLSCSSQLGFFLDCAHFRRSALAELPPNHPSRPTLALCAAVYLWAFHILNTSHQIQPAFLAYASKLAAEGLSSSHPRRIMHTLQAEILLAHYFFASGRFLEGKYHTSAAAAIGSWASRTGALPSPSDSLEGRERSMAWRVTVALDRTWAVVLHEESHCATLEPEGDQNEHNIEALFAKAAILWYQTEALGRQWRTDMTRAEGARFKSALDDLVLALEELDRDFVVEESECDDWLVRLVAHSVTHAAAMQLYGLLSHRSAEEHMQRRRLDAAIDILELAVNIPATFNTCRFVNPILGPIWLAAVGTVVTEAQSLRFEGFEPEAGRLSTILRQAMSAINVFAETCLLLSGWYPLTIWLPYPMGPDPRQSIPYNGMPGPPPFSIPFPNWHGPGPILPTPDGWYIPHSPVIPVGLPVPGPIPIPNRPPGLPPPPAPPGILKPPEDAWIHDFWKGRFAPFPGSLSSPTLVKKTPSRGVPIISPPAHDTSTSSNSQSQPPHANSHNPFETPSSSKFSTPSTQENQENKGKDLKNDEKKLDKYADIFIPQYLQDIQNQPHTLRPLPPIPLFPSIEYMQTFLPPSLIDVSTAGKSSILTYPPPATAPSMTTSYYQHWNALLSWELHKLAVDKEQIILWKTHIRIANWDAATFQLAVPGIRENTPKLDLGDVIVLREVLEARRAGSGIAFEGGVVSTRKREALIHFYCPALKAHIQQFVGPVTPPQPSHGSSILYTSESNIPLLFNISFIPTARPTFLMDVASQTVHDAITSNDDDDRRRTARRWIFPTPEDVLDEVQRHLPDQSWTDTGLNEQQKLAVSSITLHESPTPYLIIGPPGTGKTRTIVEAVLKIIHVHPESCILLCAPSNPATDTLVMRLRSKLMPHQMLRLNDPNRTFAEVPMSINQYCYIEDDRFSIPPWESLLQYRVIVCSCLDAGILVDAHCTNNILARLEVDMMRLLHPGRLRKEPIAPHFTHLLIDEAAQAAEPELLIPISVVLPGPQPTPSASNSPVTGLSFGSVKPTITPQLVLCGDPNQLGPIVAADAARDAELDISLLQRLYDREAYSSLVKKGFTLLLSSHFRPLTNLVKNYRSHPAILMPPSAMFYDDSLVPCAVNGAVTWSRLPNPRLPLMFIGSDTEEECRASWYNSGEIKCTVDTITALLAEGASSDPPLKASQIGVMSPFREQVWKIREQLRKVGLSAVDVGTVEDYQGREMRACIISCVRSSTRFLKDDLARGLGLVYDRKRMNVAITRAKELLVIVGNPAVLQQDPFWRSFLQFTVRNKLYLGPPLHLEMDGSFISRLESELVDGMDDLDEEEHGVAIAGGLAREILRERAELGISAFPSRIHHQSGAKIHQCIDDELVLDWLRSVTVAVYDSAAIGGALATSSPPVKVTLKSAWPAPPLLLEIIETVAQENPDAFFTLLDRVSDPTTHPTPQPLSDEAIQQYALQIAVSRGLLVDRGSLATVEMNLGLHAATPKIEAFYQYYATHVKDPKCGSWVDWYGEQVCDLEKLSHLAGVETIESSNASETYPSFPRPQLLPFDHILPSPARTIDRPPRTAILYASIDSPNFRELHTYLYDLADKPSPSIEYVVRHIPVGGQSRHLLSGYGVALDLKKTDYLAVDDRNTGTGKVPTQESKAESEIPEVDPVLALIEAYPERETVAGDLDDKAKALLGFQATQLIADSSEPLATLTKLSQNFPKYIKSLSRRVIVNESLETEIHANQLKAQAGVNLFWFNGMILNEKDVNPMGLLRLVRKEKTIMNSLAGLGLSRAQAIELLSHSSVSATQAESALDNVFDASDRPEGGDVIVWWNDLEKDSRYAQWPTSIHGLLRPLYPGQFHSLKLNLFNIVLVLDLSESSTLDMLTSISNIINRGLPFRFGVVPLTETEDGLRMARVFYHVVKTYGRKKTMLFLRKVGESFGTAKQPLDWSAVETIYNELLEEAADNAEATAVDFQVVVAADPESEVDVSIQRGSLYAHRLGAGKTVESGNGHAFINGKHLDVDDGFWRAMQTEIGQQLQFFQEQIYSGKITDETSSGISTYFYDQPTTSLRRNRYIFPASGEMRVVNVAELFKQTRFYIMPSSFISASSEQIPLTLFLVADLDSTEGLSLLNDALLSMNNESKTRISFIHNPTKLEADSVERPPVSWLISHLIGKGLLSRVAPSTLRCVLGLESAPPVPQDSQTPIGNDCNALELTGGVGISGYSAEDYATFVTSSRLVARELQFAPGQQGLIANGRIVGPLPPNAVLTVDFKTLENFELSRRAQPVISAIEDINPELLQTDRASSANLISIATSVLGSLQAAEPGGGGIFDPPKRPRHRNYQLLDGEYSSFQYGDNTTALCHIAVLVDPLSEYAQKWSSLLEWISHIPDIYIKVYTNPAPHEEIPLKRFYRYALLPNLAFDSDGNETGVQAIFENLPIEPIYTLAMDVPPSWLVRPREALYDLDNIQLGRLSHPSLDAEFALDYLVVDGHARDPSTNAPPRGLQLQLLSADSQPVDDTQVVANLGYLQFKAKPGVFHLEIREGRGRDIFVMESVGNEGLDSRTVEEVGNEIAVTSFAGLTIYPRLRRLPGMEQEDVLAAPSLGTNAGSGGIIDDIASRMKSFFGKGQDSPSTGVVPVSDGQADINIFTVASGLLYERFVSIMILSVLKNTKSSVKFWFIENFLSPSFLEFIPHLASAYNFQYELVTYKWPSWLRAQKEKQRIIWAYKILFLDVLFPMDLKKVIFVDADQIVRADLKELIEIDLHGAPYGYTPMGDDNTDMEGFRFWKTGYWKDFLQGMPYHISALYVIDLVRFRQLAAGDILRGQYQALSADPGSLANLDQDLPNNLQREVPIFSLHEDWLWCETWCSKDRLHRAKTIDLCQNPLTKEPKLARARQIPEWEEYDSEISRFARKLAEDGIIRSQIVSADVNALAGSPNEATKVDAPEQKASSTPDDQPPLDSETSTERERDEL